MSPLDNFNFDNALTDTGQRLEASRRLSDKIVAAFSHAYAVGELDVAKKLKDALATNEKKISPFANMRVGYDPLGQADLWVTFVKTRNKYKAEYEKNKSDSAMIAKLLEAMKEAYRSWSMG